MITKEVAVGLCILVFVILIFLSRANYNLYDDMLTGMWVSDPEWAAKADLDGMLLYVGPSDSWIGDKRKCYLILYADNRVIVSKQIEMDISSGYISYGQIIPSKHMICSVDVTDLDADVENQTDIKDEDDNIPFTDIMPKNLTLELGISSAKLVLKGIDENGEELQYAKLYKDAIATETSRERMAAEADAGMI